MYDTCVYDFVDTEKTKLTQSVTLRVKSNNFIFTITNAYCRIKEKNVFWQEARRIARKYQTDLWCIVGDLNATKDPSEKLSAARDPNRRNLVTYIDDFDLEDFPMCGGIYTCSERSRLDRY